MYVKVFKVKIYFQESQLFSPKVGKIKSRAPFFPLTHFSSFIYVFLLFNLRPMKGKKMRQKNHSWDFTYIINLCASRIKLSTVRLHLILAKRPNQQWDFVKEFDFKSHIFFYFCLIVMILLKSNLKTNMDVLFSSIFFFFKLNIIIFWNSWMENLYTVFRLRIPRLARKKVGV